MKKLASEYIHIDNGGISVEAIHEDFNTRITFNTTYHGHPSVSSTLSGHLSPEDIRKIGRSIMQAASELEKSIEAQKRDSVLDVFSSDLKASRGGNK